MPEEGQHAERRRLLQVFRYLQALHLLRSPVVRQVQDQEWSQTLESLPRHEAISLGTRNDDEGDDWILKVQRPKLTRSPSPPAKLSDWVLAGWDDFPGRADYRSSRLERAPDGSAVTVRFEADKDRVRALSDWQAARTKWIHAERPAREAMSLFERLYALHGQIQREGDRIELVLGDGFLNWRTGGGGIHHPLILKRVELVFSPQVPEFTIRESPQPVELYTALLRAVPDIEGQVIARLRKEAETLDIHPLEGGTTTAFLKGAASSLSAKGEFVTTPATGELDHPRIFRSRILFVRRRTLGFGSALEAIIENVEQTPEAPPALLSVVGVERGAAEPPSEPTAPGVGDGNQDPSILFSKPANAEQLQIARRLERHGAVLVQGPPGTGKTHTIANLIGHLLAAGKTVLVTSHTAKALHEVRDKVVPELQPLCVSVLERDAQNQAERERSVAGIGDRLSSSTSEGLRRDASRFETERSALLAKISLLRTSIREAREGEYRDIVIAGQAFQPARAARLTSAGVGVDDWLPGPLAAAEPLPLSSEEIAELYLSNLRVTAEDEKELAVALPRPDELLAPTEVRKLVETSSRLGRLERRFPDTVWTVGLEKQSAEELETVAANIRPALEAMPGNDSWLLRLTAIGIEGEKAREPYLKLLDFVQAIKEDAYDAEEETARVAPILATSLPLTDQLRVFDEILQEEPANVRFTLLSRLFHPEWVRVLSACQAAGGQPTTLPHVRILRACARIRLAREELARRWKRQVAEIGGPSEASLGMIPESAAFQMSPQMRAALLWAPEKWVPVLESIKRAGLNVDAVNSRLTPDLTPAGPALNARSLAEACATAIQERVASIRLASVERELARLEKKLDPQDAGIGAAVVGQLRTSVTSRSPQDYERAFGRLSELHGRYTDLNRRRELLRKLGAVAPAWAESIRLRRTPHAEEAPPGDCPKAWLWRQLTQEIEARDRRNAEGIEAEIQDATDALHRATAALIDRKAWAAQVDRTGLAERQALMGWSQVVKRIGKGTGKRVAQLQAESRRLMVQSQSAVPVWIMPLSRVVENFDPRKSKFDVVIIDEASQSDALALIAFYMGRQVVVVGDDKQVSPEDVGRDVGEVQRLIDEHLAGIPNAQLYDGKQSVYDIALRSFGGVISLKEHFRCVTDIIQFSNHLSYGGDIRPLRDASDVVTRPAVTEYRVAGATSSEKVNREEAIAVASLIAAAAEQPEYRQNDRDAPTSFGVISLVGEDQALEIEQLLRRYMNPIEYEQRQIVCGNSAQFQGAERDVMFLSMVDGPAGGPLRLRQEPAFEKRFNVAASRARNQMWVVHSLDPGVDLKPDDLRRRLIEHAMDPKVLMRQLESAERRAESEFERLVMRRLISDGYKVVPQWHVGYYRIDMVVEDGERRLAVECDGDRWHDIDKIPDDMARQAVLERIGWRFHRIRGTAFFRNPDHVYARLVERLKDLEIRPQAQTVRPVEEHAELRDRVIRRAAEIRREWTASRTSPA